MKKFLAFLSVLFLPVLGFAQGFGSLQETLETITDLINQLIPFAIGLAVLYFIFGLIKYVTAGGDDDKLKEARGTIIGGIVILFVMISVWGLVNVLSDTFSLNNQIPQDIPQVPR